MPNVHFTKYIPLHMAIKIGW